ncbi:RAD52 motif-containing protein 1 isoform X5 [Sparus aurata]|uniref:RAD52 motif-containing protein 1 isoform X5 n=1 Tax=Sparus aurata TaxID=8175 RepID=UPI0011C0E54C|nr:RAD52 motif-containing protein 1 isoform X5 [Sparus aurata]
MSGVMEVDILEFQVPVENNKTLFVWDIQPSHTEAQIYVRLSSKQTPHFLCDSSRPLNHARCLELANHCLGFNGWTSDIITLKELTNEEEQEEEEGGGRWRRLKFGCLLQLSFPHHGQTTRAAAVVEDRFTCTGPDVLLQKRCKLQKVVREKALVQAFATVLLILLGGGKVMVEVKQTSDQFLPEQTEGVLQVNELTWSQLAPDEEEDDEEWDLTVS